MRDLPTDLLRSFAAFAEADGLAGAGLRVGRSTSAVSLHLKQLQALTGAALVEKTGRKLTLTAAGRLLLAHAKRILEENDRAVAALGRAGGLGSARLGIVQDMADTVLSAILGDAVAAAPEIDLRIRVGNSAELLRAMGEGDVDVAVVAWSPGAPAPLCEEPMVWFGCPDLLQGSILPLALVSRPCPFWAAAETALIGAGRDFAVVLDTPSLAGVRAAAAAGFAVGCRTRPSAGADATILTPAHGLPALPTIAYTVLARPRPSPAAALLHDVATRRLQGRQSSELRGHNT